MSYKMKSLLRLIALFLGLALVCCSPLAWAQSSSGTINGRVVDPSGAVIPGASVKLVEQQTKVQVTTKAEPNGEFVFPVVQPGTYSVMADALASGDYPTRSHSVGTPGSRCSTERAGTDLQTT